MDAKNQRNFWRNFEGVNPIFIGGGRPMHHRSMGGKVFGHWSLMAMRGSRLASSGMRGRACWSGGRIIDPRPGPGWRREVCLASRQAGHHKSKMRTVVRMLERGLYAHWAGAAKPGPRLRVEFGRRPYRSCSPMQFVSAGQHRPTQWRYAWQAKKTGDHGSGRLPSPQGEDGL